MMRRFWEMLLGKSWAIILAVLIAAYVLSYLPQKPEFKVIDPDTVNIGLDKNVRITFSDGTGFEGPERGGRARCEAEAELAELGTAYAEKLLSEARFIRLDQTEPGKRDFYGRHLGDLALGRRSFAEEMLAAGYGKRWDYDGCGSACRPKFCGEDLKDE